MSVGSAPEHSRAASFAIGTTSPLRNTEPEPDKTDQISRVDAWVLTWR